MSLKLKAGEVIPYVLDQNNDKEVEKFSEEITDGNNKIDLLVNICIPRV